MSILGYYDSSGNRINNAVDANGALKDVVDGIHRADLRPAVVLYAMELWHSLASHRCTPSSCGISPCLCSNLLPLTMLVLSLLE
jgi:hypothetical protein